MIQDMLLRLIFTLLLSAPVFGAPPSSSPIRIQIPTDPVTLDPQKITDLAGVKILTNTFEGLLRYNARGELVNGLAESYEISRDRKTYVFKLRANARWSDGEPLTAAQFVAGYSRALDPKLGSKYVASLFAIRGARAIYAGQAPLATLGLRAKDRILTVELERPCGHFLHLVTLPVLFPHRTGMEGKPGEPTPGAYFVSERAHDRSLRRRKNPHYYGAAPKSDIDLLVVTDEATGASLFESGNLDLLTKFASLDSARLAGFGVVRSDPFSATTVIGMNPGRAPLDRREFRLAIARAIDKPGILKAVGENELMAGGLLPPGFEGYFPAPAATAPPAPRKLELPAGATLTAVYDSSAKNGIIMQKLQADLRTRLELPLGLEALEWKNYISRLLRDPPQIYRLTWPAWYRDSYSFLEIFTTGHAANLIKFSNTRYDRLVDELAQLPPGKKRSRLAEAAQRILVEEEAIMVPLFHANQQHVLARNITGFAVNPLGAIWLADLSRK